MSSCKLDKFPYNMSRSKLENCPYNMLSSKPDECSYNMSKVCQDLNQKNVCAVCRAQNQTFTYIHIISRNLYYTTCQNFNYPDIPSHKFQQRIVYILWHYVFLTYERTPDFIIYRSKCSFQDKISN